MNMCTTMAAKFARLFDTEALTESSLVLAPLVLGAFVSEREVWLQASLVTISSYIALKRSDLAPLGVVIHGFAIAAGFLSLLLSLAIPALFVLFAAMMAMASIWLTAYGKQLRALGSFTFIPALYLACEIAERTTMSGVLLQRGLAFLPYLAMGMVPVLLMSCIQHHLAARADFPYLRHFSKILQRSGPAQLVHYWESIIAVTLSVAVAAAIVEGYHMNYGQWVIWSAASVVTGDIVSARAKLRDRLVGAAVGVPAGVILGMALPHDRFVLELAAVAAVMTLVIFRSYPVSVATRCACVAVLFVVAGQSSIAAAQRLENVALGCMIGMAFVLATHATSSRIVRRSP